MAAELKIFSLKWYLDHNPDVAAAVAQGLVDAFQHFELYGKVEGRSMGPLFDVDLYLQQNPDVADAVARGETTAYDHFVQFGAGEERTPSALFDEAFYLLQNPDVAAAVQAGTVTAVQHFLSYGQSEPRPFNPSIDLGAYLQANPDIAAAVQNGFMSAMEHLMVYGATEGRDLGNGVNLGMFANDDSFQQALSSGDIAGALQRVGDVAPFLPTFQPPVGWTPPPDTPIPLDFVPPAGTQLVIPPTVVVPPDVVLPPIFTPPAPPGPTPGGGGGTPSPTFSVALSGDGTATFSGTATGNITMTVDGDGMATFVRGSVTASLKPSTNDIHKLTVGSGMTLLALEDDVSAMEQIDLVSGGLLRVTTSFEDLSADNQSLKSADISKVTVNGAHGPDAIWASVSVTSGEIADKFKLFWVTGDEKYYAALYSEEPPLTQDKAVNDANLELSIIYAEYLKGGGTPILDVIQTKVAGGVEDWNERQQTLHDNLLGNLNDLAITSRINDGVLTDPNFDSDDAAQIFRERPFYDGRLVKTGYKDATIVWDTAHGIDRGLKDDGQIYVVHAGKNVTAHSSVQGAIDAAQGGDLIYVGPGTYGDHDVRVAKPNLHVILSAEAIILGGFAIQTAADGFHLSGDGTIQGGMASNLIAGSAGKAVYVQKNADVTIEGVTLLGTGELAGQLRGIEVEGGSSHVSVDDVAIQGWVTGIFVNPGNQLSVTGSTLSNNGVGIGTDGPNTLNVSVNTFTENHWEDIGLTPGKVIGSVDISNNEYSGDGITAINNGTDTGLLELYGTNVLLGSNNNDVLIGASGSETILGLAGNDIIRGDVTPPNGQQYLPASYGDDLIDGGLGTNILILGTTHHDIQLGGQDTIIAGGAGQGKDIIFNFNFGPIERYDDISQGGGSGNDVDPSKVVGADLTFDIIAFQMTKEVFLNSATILFGQDDDAYKIPTNAVAGEGVTWSGSTATNVGGSNLFAGTSKEYELVIRFNDDAASELVFANAMSRFEKARFLNALDDKWTNTNETDVNNELDSLRYEADSDANPSAGLVTLTADQVSKMVDMMEQQGNFTFFSDVA